MTRPTTPSDLVPWARPAVALPVLASTVLVGWIGVLAVTLPGTYAATDWDAAWVGFDALLAILLAATGWLTYRRHPGRVLVGSGAAVLLVADAWFDVTTATGSDQISALVSALLVELPLAAYLAYRATRALTHLAPRATAG